MKSTPLDVNGILYFTVPNHVWAVDARTGRQIWHFQLQSEGNYIALRGVAMYKDRLFFGNPDANLYTCSIVAINPDTGKMDWYFQASPTRYPGPRRR